MKNFITTFQSKEGRGGWARYQIPDEIYEKMLELENSNKQKITEKNLLVIGFEKTEHNKKVFVVHGHDEAVKYQVSYFLKQIGLDPIILHEQANMGRTIIEKLHNYANEVVFAVVLLTPDDLGCAKVDFDNFEKLKPRARQNVVLELGLFIGLLGIKKVCALMKDTIERPSDYDGVLYINIDTSNGWQMHLARELKAAGLKINFESLVN